MKYDAEVIGKNIRRERDRCKLTQDKLGKRIGVTGKQISNYEHGEPMPPMDVILKLCEVFECELGFLLGEESYAEGTKLQTAVRGYLGITAEASDNIRKISGHGRASLAFKFHPEKYALVLNKLLASPQFLFVIEAMGELDTQLDAQRKPMLELETKYGKEIMDEAYRCEHGPTDYAHDPAGEDLEPKVCAAIRDLQHAESESCELSYPVKVARYELREAFELLVDALYPRH